MRLSGITDCHGATIRDCHLIGIPGTVVRTATLINCTLRGLKVESCMLVGCHLTESCVLGVAVAATQPVYSHCWPDGASSYGPNHPFLEDDFPMDVGPADNIAQMAAAARWRSRAPRGSVRTAVHNSFGTSIETMDSPMNSPLLRILSPFNASSGLERTERRVYASHMHQFSPFGRPLTAADQDHSPAIPMWVNEIVRPPRMRAGRVAKEGEEECPVCRVNVPTERPSQNCGHALCPGCVDTLTVRNERRCPLCREPW